MNKFRITVSEELRSQSVMDGDHYYVPVSVQRGAIIIVLKVCMGYGV
jgi:hypothetical protein